MPDGSSQKPETPKYALWETHRKIHPKAVIGRFRSMKTWLLYGLLAFFMVLPWIRWDRGPDAPSQAVLFDMSQGRFFIFGLEIWPQEIYYLTGLLVIAAIGLFMATALAGRVWCGFTCPQTVWTDLFVWAERLAEGDRAERIRNDMAPMNRRKLMRKTAKHAMWLGISLVSAFGFCAYFGDAPTLLTDLVTFQATGTEWSFFAMFGIGTYVMAGWAREQMCMYMCPWPRIQSAMLDEHSLVVTYDAARGDSRGPRRKSETWEERTARGLGDCIDCNQCVQVCPMGIDVRTGEQSDCINCGLCVDACDSIMDSVGRPRGLIAFESLARQAAMAAEPAAPAAAQCATPAAAPAVVKKPKPQLARARIIVYLVLMTVIGSAMTIALTQRSAFTLAVQRDRAPLYITLSNGSIRNAYTVKIANKTREDRHYVLTASGVPGLTLSMAGSEDTHGDRLTVNAGGDSVGTFRVYVTVPAGTKLDASNPLTIVSAAEEGRKERTSYATVFMAPAP
ncbi:cytochrome c oxidase accessory protein FixG [Azospirillum fermentarium]|uniref:cytochrome c oxidase accessory protein CcoG n=1 Tax=Azospirillum fermentarium TaxID=1233114 RepID=UPI0022264A7B|nr:cytochrome c oxidase accessory protein CcoG [Azospirillum fermentarium]MCW2246708.1 cytochrome c oxidase accessory protein FixG [Azospirillum fermentarium]